jgi:hypothetical protein
MISPIPRPEVGNIDLLHRQAWEAWRSWQAQLQTAGEDPEFALLFAERAPEAWAPVRESALRLGLAMLVDGGYVEPPGPDLYVVSTPAVSTVEPEPPEADVPPGETLPGATGPVLLQPEPELPAPMPIPTPGTAQLVNVEASTLRMLEERMNGHCVTPARERDTPLQRLRSSVGRTPKRDLDKALLRNQIRDLPAKVSWSELVALDADDRHLALTWLAARLRMLQELTHIDPSAPTTGLTDLARLLTRAVALGVSRHVHGLARKHEPLNGSWMQDALVAEAKIDERTGRTEPASILTRPSRDGLVDDAFRRLRAAAADEAAPVWLSIVDELVTLGVRDSDVRWVGPLSRHLTEVAGTADRDRIRRAVTRALADAESDVPMPKDWPYLALTRGKRAVILGGDGRQERIPHIRERFEFAALDWPDLPEGAPRAVQTEVKKLRSGKYDLAIVLQHFISHSVTDKVFRLKVDGLTVVLAEGYGTGQLQQGLERFLKRGMVL